MKISQIDENSISVYLKGEYIDFDSKNDLEEYFIDLFSRLRDFYNIKISG